MKRLIYMAIALVVLIAANSCKNKTNTPVISANDSTEVEDAANDSTIYGVCGEGTYRVACLLATASPSSDIRRKMVS